MGRVVLVTGVAGSFASRVSRALAELGADGGVDRVVGLDLRPPEGDLGGVKFVRADIRTPVVAKVIAVEEIDTVLHLDLAPAEGRGSGGAKERNVIGTMQLLAACQRSSVVSKLVLGSTTAVYGSSPRDPAMFAESASARGGIRSGFPKDAVEVESYVRGFARRRPDILITTLRSAQILHPDIDTPLRSYFNTPILPAALGYDPRLQFLHLDDALAIATQAVVSDRPGTFNVAGDGVVLLSQAARRLGRPVLPLPPVGFASAAGRVIRSLGGEMSPDLHRLLTHGRAVDTTALREIFGYELQHTTEETLEEFRQAQRPGVLAVLGGAR
ncbi:epimerase [Aeromicrobium sp. Root495]|uniref:NAD-dependent epimerase/dehydratase family protein n=1 Tax=Aeromicrobium sp. Root495 TaxID=1736550 RepID=UPI0006FF6C6B|nr:NAD-dependent epimerase/dehydratase family protein [Aeromicrobium sp. Root495]KQY60412.1 epimerase [Aeromicrobium sp. Root495]